jgi:hypothetical protein
MQVEPPGRQGGRGQLVDRQGRGQGAGVAAGGRQQVGQGREQVVNDFGRRRGLVAHEVVDLAHGAVQGLVVSEGGGGVDQVGGGGRVVHEDYCS